MSKHFKNLFNLLDKLNQTYAKAEEGGNVVDDELSLTSENPVQNKVVTGAIGTVSQAKAAKSDIAPTFSETDYYNKGDLAYYNGDLYEFQQFHFGPFDISDVDTANISGKLTSLEPQNIYEGSITSDLMTWGSLITLISNNVSFDQNTRYMIKIGGDTFTQGGANSFYMVNVTMSGVVTLGINFRGEKAFSGSSEITNSAMGYEADTAILVYELPY